MIDLKPTIRVLEDGKLGYFYSPHQLEHILMTRWMHRVSKQIHAKVHNRTNEKSIHEMTTLALLGK